MKHLYDLLTQINLCDLMYGPTATKEVLLAAIKDLEAEEKRFKSYDGLSLLDTLEPVSQD